MHCEATNLVSVEGKEITYVWIVVTDRIYLDAAGELYDFAFLRHSSFQIFLGPWSTA